jgi:hypothetical protein
MLTLFSFGVIWLADCTVRLDDSNFPIAVSFPSMLLALTSRTRWSDQLKLKVRLLVRLDTTQLAGSFRRGICFPNLLAESVIVVIIPSRHAQG